MFHKFINPLKTNIEEDIAIFWTMNDAPGHKGDKGSMFFTQVTFQLLGNCGQVSLRNSQVSFRNGPVR